MDDLKLKISLLSDCLVGSGESYGAIIDSDITYDEFGFPYIPSKRIKGLLKNSLEELISYFKIAGIKYFADEDVELIFGKKGDIKSGDVYFSNLFINEYSENKNAVKNLKNKYKDFLNKESLLNYFTSIRHNIEINEKGTTKEHSLRTIRVLNKDTEFTGTVTVLNNNKVLIEKLGLACHNLRYMGTKRNRGLGYIKCELFESGSNLNTEVIKQMEVLCNT